eukprot:TRINITY_DN885_c0_g1_i1.p1 TRINITY_DN885_c0_g1~~TRINITY_DN885_c0_g1_i1.p1  ORF type:complete len:294 (+),score=34.77 TRINITY_DN885_c0_g1_i1:537-1418(+)
MLLLMLVGHHGKVYSFDWSNENWDMVSVSQDAKMIVWDALSATKLHSIPLGSSWMTTCAFSPSSRFIGCGGLDNELNIYTLNSVYGHTHMRTLSGHSDFISGCKFLTEDTIITSSGDKTCSLWDFETNLVTRTFRGHDSEILTLDISCDSNTFISGSTDSTVKLWDIRVNNYVKSYHHHMADVNTVRYFPNGVTFASGSDDATCKLFDKRTDSEIKCYSEESIISGVFSIDFTLSGRILFAGYDDAVCRGWDILTGEVVSKLEDNTRLTCIGMAPDGMALALGGWSSRIKIWA